MPAYYTFICKECENKQIVEIGSKAQIPIVKCQHCKTTMVRAIPEKKRYDLSKNTIKEIT